MPHSSCSSLAKDAAATRDTLEYCKRILAAPRTAPVSPGGGGAAAAEAVPSSPATVAELAMAFGGTTPRSAGQVWP